MNAATNSGPLYHFSEDPELRVFVPHTAPTSSDPEAYVWAIDAWHAPMYYVPRDCPRACFWATDATPAEARHLFGVPTGARMVIAIQADWLPRLRTTSLYRYTMPGGAFTLRDATAGHWVSRETVTPSAIEPVGDLLTALTESGVELRITPNLAALARAVVPSGLEFSMTRLRNLPDWTR